MNWKEISRKKLNSFHELPKEEWEAFELCPLVGEIWQVEVEVNFEISELPHDMLFDELKRRLECNEFENIEEVKEEFERRGYTIDINPTVKNTAMLKVSNNES